MPEYIEREAALKELNRNSITKKLTLANGASIFDTIKNIPAADVVEVIHGKWEAGHYEGGIFDGTNFEKCSVCQFERIFEDIRFKTTFNYCPNCGAKMDLKEGAEE